MKVNTFTPCCKQKASFDLMESATLAVDRTCRKCGQRYRVIVSPLATRGADYVHRVDWTPY
jgi:hypothetical protein